MLARKLARFHAIRRSGSRPSARWSKTTGKEVAFTRLTAQEKGRLTDVVYGFRRQGIRTSENEVLRIAINHLLEDFEANGKHSFLQKVIEALLA